MEELDFVGPMEVLASFAKYVDQDWQVVTVAESKEPVKADKGLVVVPDHAFADCPALDILIVPGGLGTRSEVDNPRLIEFVKGTGESAEWVTSVCTGAFILSRAGFLTGRRATTHWAALQDLRKEPGVTVVEERFVQDGKVITAAGVSAGIDMALHIVGLVKDPEAARVVQKLIEYYPEPPYAEVAGSVGRGTN
jgi:transcriptional regulator GlxA family with amidase domain